MIRPKKLFPFLAGLALSLSLSGCEKVTKITAPWHDDFARQEIGPNYHNTGGSYRIEAGKLKIKGAHNRTLWLKRPIPHNAEIEVDVRSDSPDGDIKLEVWGDGESFSPRGGTYLASSYVFIFGGWGNTISAICRLDEHGKDRKERRDVKVEKGKTYHWKISRKGKKIDWFIDGKPFLSMNDPAPLAGKNHAYLGFNNWASAITYDNLTIKPL